MTIISSTLAFNIRFMLSSSSRLGSEFYIAGSLLAPALRDAVEGRTHPLKYYKAKWRLVPQVI
jgi:hypothetical protein